ncbi:MAG: hypothetical protein QOG30_2329 [Acidimicrobiaceae bacterium]
MVGGNSKRGTVASMLELELLAGATLESAPYQWAYVPNAIPHRPAAELLATFPDVDFWHVQAHDGEKYFDYLNRPLVLLGHDRPWRAETLAPVWQSVAEQVLSRSYRSALESLLGRSLDDAVVEASVWRWHPNAQIGPHVDHVSKVLTQVVYFNVGWRAEWGGCLRVLGSSDPLDSMSELPPALGSSSVVVRSDRSWHCVTPVLSSAPMERLSLIVTWLLEGSSSPAWDVEPDGSVVAKCGIAPVAVVRG